MSTSKKPRNILCALLLLLVVTPMNASATGAEQVLPLDGGWRFRLDPEDKGFSERWFGKSFDHSSWRAVQVPHTWQVEPGTEDYRGVGWYSLEIDQIVLRKNQRIRLEFDSIYRDATVWLNGEVVGDHNGSGWTPFSFFLDKHWQKKKTNTLVVRVDNRFSEDALPYIDSSDWAADGGIIRSVRLRLLPSSFINHLLIDTDLSPTFDKARVSARVRVDGDCKDGFKLNGWIRPDKGGEVLPVAQVQAGDDFILRAELVNPDLWHFDFPHLYRLRTELSCGEELIHFKESTFGIRKVEVKNGFYYLNGEPMRLMGVEWMPGSDPRYGMAEPSSVMRRILKDMKELNSVITRFHWQQDPFVFEFCDREGMLLQEEVPAWGPRTMQGEFRDIQTSQMEEMITAHYNHPSIYAWGLCNEIHGQSEKAHAFVRRGIEIAREIDPSRLLTWASNSLQKTPEKDASGLVDFIEWNDYYESWFGGNLTALEKNLKAIADAFPEKSLVISEYGLCECDPRNPVGDGRRIEILETHTERYRKASNVAGAIFFDYNDYRTHIGDKGEGAFRQRVHGVVDLLGRRKPSWSALRAQSSPVRKLGISAPQTESETTRATVDIQTRSLENDLPAYTLRGYSLVWTAYNDLGHPLQNGNIPLPELPPGSRKEIDLVWKDLPDPARIYIEIFRPTGYSVTEAKWIR